MPRETTGQVNFETFVRGLFSRDRQRSRKLLAGLTVGTASLLLLGSCFACARQDATPAVLPVGGSLTTPIAITDTPPPTFEAKNVPTAQAMGTDIAATETAVAPKPPATPEATATEAQPTVTAVESPFGPDGKTAKYPLIFVDQLVNPLHGKPEIHLPTDAKGVVRTGIFTWVLNPKEKYNTNIVSAIVVGKQENSLLPLIVNVDGKPMKIFLKTNEVMPGNSQVLEGGFATIPVSGYDGYEHWSPPHQKTESQLDNLNVGTQLIIELNGQYQKPLENCPDPSRCAYMNYLSDTFGPENDKLGNGSQKIKENQVLHYPWAVMAATDKSNK